MAVKSADDSAVDVSLLEAEDAELTRSFRRLHFLLRLFGFCQDTIVLALLSWLAFLLIGVVIPVLVIELSDCESCHKFQIKPFELEILISQAIVAAISLLCISHGLRKHGLHKFLFVDQSRGYNVQFRDKYIAKINDFYSMLGGWLLICLLLKTTREVTRAIYLNHYSSWQSILILVASLICWAYLNIVYLLGTALFHLVGNLQIIHFENYGKLLEKDLDVSCYIEEHMSLTRNLSKISHRFRIFLLLEFLFVTASQFVALLQTTENQGIINFINAGDFAVLSIAQLVGIVLCLNAAAKISHRSQSLGAVACRWHALVTCNSSEASQCGFSNDVENVENINPAGLLSINYSESDLDSIDHVSPPANMKFSSYMSSYHKRQAFVAYIRSNSGGFTIFGWTIDRHLINTIFFIELSLVFFVLG